MIKNIIIGVISVIVAVITSLALVGNNQPSQNLQGTTAYDEINVQDFDEDGTYGYAVNGTTIIDKNQSLTLTGTTTLSQSVEGLIVGGTISPIATGTPITVYTNSTGPKLCVSSLGYVFANNNGSFSPSLRMSLGTSTATVVATTNLVASTTMATSTDKYTSLTNYLFVLNNGEKLVAIFDDNGNTTNASSTYFSRWTVEAGVWCQDITI